MDILFIDMHNKFRSKIAEAIFKKLAGDKIGAKSVGLVLDFMRPFVCQNVHSAIEELGYKIHNDQPMQLYRHDFEWADKIIIVMKDFPVDVFRRVKEKVEVWQIESADEMEGEKIKEITMNIESKVKELVGRLE